MPWRKCAWCSVTEETNLTWGIRVGLSEQVIVELKRQVKSRLGMFQKVMHGSIREEIKTSSLRSSVWVQQRQVCAGHAKALGMRRHWEFLSRSNMIRLMFLERLPCLNIPKYSDPPQGIRLRGTVQTGEDQSKGYLQGSNGKVMKD